MLVYENNQSIKIKDRNNQIIFTKPNPVGYYTEYSEEIPEKFKELLLKKEDKYFYYHFGVNPISSLHALCKYVTKEQNSRIASSTITQELTKNLREILKGFENDLRSYTLVEDKEYKYTIESGFAFYPNKTPFKKEFYFTACRLLYGEFEPFDCGIEEMG